MNRPTSGSCSRVAASSPALGHLRDGVRAVEILVDVLDQVGRAHLRQYVVGRVVVALAGALGHLEPRDQLGGAGGSGAGPRSGDGVQPRTIGSAGSSAASTASGVTTQ